jgi:hypothetical protein
MLFDIPMCLHIVGQCDPSAAASMLLLPRVVQLTHCLNGGCLQQARAVQRHTGHT